MDLEKESLIVRSRVMVEELRDQYARFTYMSQPIRRVWRRSAGLMEELIATIETSQKKI